MSKLYLVIHPKSYKSVTRVSDYIWERVQEFAGGDAEKHMVEHVDAVDFAKGSTVLIIGEKFRSFEREAGCRYVFLNFSVMHLLGNPFACDLYALRMMAAKRKFLRRKLPSLDFVLDYFDEHASVLRRKLDIPVLTFPVSVTPSAKPLDPIAARPMDICFVGEMTSRRKKLIAKLDEFKFGPQNGVVLEDEVERSRITLNVHVRRSNHFEFPRAIAAISRGSVLVTENSFGMSSAIPNDLVIANRYSGACRLCAARVGGFGRPSSAGHQGKALVRHDTSAEKQRRLARTSVKGVELGRQASASSSCRMSRSSGRLVLPGRQTSE